MKQKMKIVSMLIAIPIATASYAFFQAAPKPWPVPDKNSNMANPVKSDDASLKTGKAVWSKDCASCHGKTGKGDGTKAKGLKTHAGDLHQQLRKTKRMEHYIIRLSKGEKICHPLRRKFRCRRDLECDQLYAHI
jgi:cytochrome c553